MGERTHEMAFNVTEFVEKRAAQIHDLLAVIDNSSLVAGEVTKGPRTAAQRLPRHMRRRAMSHNVKRMPRRFRAFARPYLERSKHRAKPPSRFARRRPKNLLLNYVRRQRSQAWLETHIWHAKRFHIVDRWGYRLPDRSYQRAFRPIYRTTRRGAVVRDKSYLGCLLLSAPSQSVLISTLSPLCCPSAVEASVRGVGGRDGTREISTLMYRKDAYPHGLIGPARFQWSTSDDGRAQLALWLHPSCRAAVLQELQLLLQLQKKQQEEPDEETKKKLSSPDNITEWRAARAQLLTEVYEGADGVKMEDLRDQLVRLRLVGPKSLRVLAESLRLVEGKEAEAYEQQHACWREVYSRVPPGELQDGLAISLLVEDPRCGRPARRGLLEREVPPPAVDPDEVNHPTPTATLWSREERLRVMEARLSNSSMAELRGASIGGMIAQTAAKIPVVVVIRSAAAEEMTLSGADIIAPAGFGADLWIALQLRTARASGLRDELAAHAESATPAFPADSVDSRAGEEEAKREKREKEDKHFARPHNRRPSFWDGLSIKYPFSFEWAELVADWNKVGNSAASAGEPYVLRDRRLLQCLALFLGGKGGEKAVAQFREMVSEHSHALVQVQIDCVKRGRPRRFATICLGQPEEVTRKRAKGEQSYTEPSRTEIKDQPKNQNGDEEEMEVEQEMTKEEKKQWQDALWKDVVSTDVTSREKTISLKEMFATKTVSKERKRTLLNRKKKLRQKRRRMTAGTRAAEAERIAKEMAATSYRDSATRPVCGRVLRGDFCFTAAKGRAIGLVPIQAIAEIRERRGEVMVRNTTSKYYHAARATVSMARLTL
ncbi:hypothetical protein PRIPAC_94233 [Pristionchus pacificus]|nr:hypothetical protein PRIPAC_94233 [Pristionchus pacificus]